MQLFEYEKNIEADLQKWLADNDLEATASRSVEELNASNIQITSQYSGAIEDTRQQINGILEYDNHEASLTILVSTFRDDKQSHFERVAKIRSLLLIHLQPIKYYHIYDIVPQASTNIELAENNADQTQLNYIIKFRVDLSQFKE